VKKIAAKHSRTVGLGALLIAITTIAYWRVTGLGFIWDDDLIFAENPLMQSLDGLRLIWFDVRAANQYYPVTWTTLWLQHQIWGLDPAPLHTTNVALHAFSVLLIWRILLVLKVPGAWLAAAVFAVHPVHVESVAWISERKNVLSAAFYLGSALAYLKFAQLDRLHAQRKPNWILYLLSLLLFILALLSKTVASTLPVALLLVLWWKQGHIDRRDVLPFLPFFTFGIALGLLTVWLEKVQVGATGPEWDLSLIDRCLIAGRALWFYAGKLAWPDSLTFVYPRWKIDASVWWQYLFPISAAALAEGLWLLRGRIGRGPLTAALYFGLTLGPALGFFDVYPMRYSFVADHFQYLASLGPIVLACAGIQIGLDRLSGHGKAPALAVCALALLALASLTWLRLPAFENLGTLWRDTLEKNPTAWMARGNLAEWHRSRNETEEAMRNYLEALNIENPNKDYVHNNLATYLVLLDRPDEAKVHYAKAIEIRGDYALARYNLAVLLFHEGDFDETIMHLQKAVSARPDYQAAHYLLGKALTKAGRPEESFDHFVIAARLKREVEARRQPDPSPGDHD
jgi:protein O-mannosyl-transferase